MASALLGLFQSRVFLISISMSPLFCDAVPLNTLLSLDSFINLSVAREQAALDNWPSLLLCN